MDWLIDWLIYWSICFQLSLKAVGVDTRLPGASDSGVTYPRYDELSGHWKKDDYVFIHKEIFEEMAKGDIKNKIFVL